MPFQKESANEMMPIDMAWAVLKGTRQTELGEFHPDLPSSHGPITAFRRIPRRFRVSQLPVDEQGEPDYDYTPSKVAMIQGLKPTTSDYSTLWENMYENLPPSRRQRTDDGKLIEPFDLSEPGVWVHPPSKNVPSSEDTTVGIRGELPPGQFRDVGWEDEPAEGYLSEPIPPERLVHNINEGDLPDVEPVWLEKAWAVLKAGAITMPWFTEEIAQQHPEKLFLFGDNEKGVGSGPRSGQAVIRHEPNSHGIRTKAAPHMGDSAFWSDDNYDANVAMIDEDLDAAIATGKQLVLPEAGWGGERAQLAEKAPLTNEYLQGRYQELLRVDEGPPDLFGGE